MSPTSVRKTQLLYQTVVQQLESKLLQLQSRRESMDDRAFVVVNEELTSCRSHSPDITTDGVNDQSDLYYGEVGSLVSTATDIIIKALEIKLSYVCSVLERLSLLVSDNPHQATPTELSFSHYEEWLDSNQQLFEFNSQLYELERVKFDLKKKQERVKQAGKGLAMPGDFDSSSAGQLAYRQAQVLLTKFQNQHAHSSHTTRVYIHELLNPRGGKTTLESEKVREYVAQCFQYANADINEVKGIHSESYQEFMAVLCSYIVEKQRERQREDVSSELVYSAVERCMMPQLKTLILSRVSQRERDDIINEKCHAFSNVTMDQLRVRPQLQSNEPVPFIESITQLRASYFSSTPTDKMYSVVAAVKALYDQLGYLGESSVDGDAFLDLWIYVIIKANVKDLATNLRFMTEYGNPQLANGEAGYYLTTLEAAVEFITTLTPQLLQSPRGEMEFVVCERAHFMSLCSMPGSGMELVTKETEMQGYRIAVLKDWALNRARLFRSALVPTANYSDSAKVAVIRVKQENTNPAITQYLLKQLRCVELTERGLFSKSIPLGIGIFINMTSVDHHNVIILPTGDYDHHISDLRHILQLQRLDSLSHDAGEQDSCLIYSPSPSRSQTLNLPVSPPYHSIMIQDSSQVEGHVGESFPAGRCGRMERESGHSHRPLWSPYVLSQNPSPEQDRVCEATFIHQELSIKSEHRRLEQCRNTPNSVLQSGPIPHSYPRSSPRGTTNEWSGTREKHSRVSRPTSITIQAEVHDTATAVPPHNTGGCDNKPVSKGTSEHFRNQDDMTASERGAHVGLCTDDTGENDDHSSEGDRDESAQLLVCDIRGNGRQEDVDVNTSVYCETRDTLKAEKIAKTYGQAGTYNDGTTKSSESDADSPEDILSPEYTEMLEEAFVANHLYGNSPPSVIEAVHSIILQAQLFLQRLNYLSVSYQITGEFDDITLRAVQMFQRAHNHHGAQYSMTLPENGHLTSPTYQFLRQAYLLIYASMLRIGLDKHLGENYDPMSTAPQDAALFRKCVSDLQTQQGLKECQAGSMCANTITRVKQMLHTQKGKPVHHVDKKNVCV